jgi:hypothetical protein
VLGDGVGTVGLPLASTRMRSGRLGMWESCSMAIVGLRALTTPLYLCGAVRMGTHCNTWQAPLIRARIELVFQFWRSFQKEGDHIPNKNRLFALENGYLGAENTLLRISLGNAAADGGLLRAGRLGLCR